MATLTKKQQAERAEAIGELREMFKPGDRVTTLLRHVSRSGMQRSISVLYGDQDVSYMVAQALGDRVDKWGGVVVPGCGMDMGFHLVYSLSRTLYPVWDCVGDRTCPSNTHFNPGKDRDNYGVGQAHSDGYALKQRWV